MKKLLAAICCLLVFAADEIAYAQNSPNDGIRIEGFVSDENEAAISNATVSFVSSAENLTTTTDENGQFVIQAQSFQKARITVSAEGFARFQKNLSQISAPLEIALSPTAVTEEISVTGGETRLGETPASVVALQRRELEQSPAVSLDDKLRQVPGFSLFRRTGSRAANPTTQGVSLRGVGASGASRALVLVEGVPLNDPFGGWIYWARVPRESIARIEILRGAASDIYGSSAVGGVVSIVTKKTEEKPVLNLEASYGSQKTPEGSFYAAAGKNGWRASVSGETFKTDGYFLISEQDRGAADNRANVSRNAANLTLERSFGETGRIFASGAFYEEDRNNGTRLQTNDTNLRNLVFGGDWQSARVGSFASRFYAQSQDYDQSFSAVSADRNGESLTRLQRVPAQVVGLNYQFSRNFGAKNVLLAGFNFREVRGRSDEIAFANNRAASAVSAGGRERSFGVFAADIFRINSRFNLSGGVRFDRWQNFAASSATKSLLNSTPATILRFPNRAESAFSPRISAFYRLSENISLAASFARAFRQPTLNELYRSFRVGDVLTLANENLRAERATSGEIGVVASGFQNRFYLRSTAFLIENARTVSNVTLMVTPNLITRQRQNLGKTRARGLELDFEFRPNSDWNFSGGYLLADSRVVVFPANRALVGRYIPQVARHQFTFQAGYAAPFKINLSIQARASGKQFDDDQNLLPLSGYFTLDGFVSKQINRIFAVFGGVENMFNQRYEVGRTPITTLGAPLTARIGLRLRFGAK